MDVKLQGAMYWFIIEDNKGSLRGGWQMQSAEINKLKHGIVVSLCMSVLTTVYWKTKTSHVEKEKKSPNLCIIGLCVIDLPRGGEVDFHFRL